MISVVIKTAPAPLRDEPGIQAMLRHEAELLEVLQGPGVVRLLGNDVRSLVLEHLPGGDLFVSSGPTVARVAPAAGRAGGGPAAPA